MATPTITVSVAFGNNPLDASYTWTDITAYVRGGAPSIAVRGGRQFELNKIEASTATVLLNNQDRRFDPTNAAGPYAPNIRPMVPIEIEATYLAATWPLFTGYVEAWPPSYAAFDSTVQIRCVDALKYFARVKISGAFASAASDAQVSAILDAISWPAGRRIIASGKSTLQAFTLATGSVLQQLQLIADSENGLFFVDRYGNVTFQDRHYRYQTPNSNTSQATFGDGGGSELPYLALDPSFDDTLIANDIHVTAAGGFEQVATSATSQARYFTRTLSKSGLLMTSDAEAADCASWLLSLYAEPALRFGRLTTDGHLSDSLWTQLLARQISDRITVRRRPPGGGALIEQDCYIEAYEFQVGANGTPWQVAWQLSPVGGATVFTFDDAVLGRFDYNSFGY